MLSVVMVAMMVISCSNKRSYETVDGDPMKSRIYTLDNGLKVYLTVNKETPRIQTYIPVRVGGKNDPAETTGLAHYFEHLMFKGSESSAHRTMPRRSLCSTRSKRSLRYTVPRLTRLSAQLSIVLSTVFHTRLQSCQFPMNMTS